MTQHIDSPRLPVSHVVPCDLRDDDVLIRPAVSLRRGDRLLLSDRVEGFAVAAYGPAHKDCALLGFLRKDGEGSVSAALAHLEERRSTAF